MTELIENYLFYYDKLYGSGPSAHAPDEEDVLLDKLDTLWYSMSDNEIFIVNEKIKDYNTSHKYLWD